MKKRMLEIDEANKKIFINSSSVDIISTCRRKAEYILKRNAVKNTETSSQAFGTAIHKALACYYSEPNRDQETVRKSLNQFESDSHSFATFNDTKRTYEIGHKILNNYFQVYKDDPFVTISDQNGLMIEREFEKYLFSYDGYDVYYFGTIDMAVRDKNTSEVFLMDHKTSVSLGADFHARHKVSNQMTGYVWALNECFGLACNTAIINGIQVAKTVQGTIRIMIPVHKDQIEEWKLSVKDAVRQYLFSLSMQHFPMAANSACGQWGGCQFLDICSTPAALRENMLVNMQVMNELSGG